MMINYGIDTLLVFLEFFCETEEKRFVEKMFDNLKKMRGLFGDLREMFRLRKR